MQSSKLGPIAGAERLDKDRNKASQRRTRFVSADRPAPRDAVAAAAAWSTSPIGLACLLPGSSLEELEIDDFRNLSRIAVRGRPAGREIHPGEDLSPLCGSTDRGTTARHGVP